MRKKSTLSSPRTANKKAPATTQLRKHRKSRRVFPCERLLKLSTKAVTSAAQATTKRKRKRRGTGGCSSHERFYVLVVSSRSTQNHEKQRFSPSKNLVFRYPKTRFLMVLGWKQRDSMGWLFEECWALETWICLSLEKPLNILPQRCFSKAQNGQKSPETQEDEPNGLSFLRSLKLKHLATLSAALHLLQTWSLSKGNFPPTVIWFKA